MNTNLRINEPDNYINSYLSLAKRDLDAEGFQKHKSAFLHFIGEKTLSTEAILRLMKTVLKHGIEYRNESLPILVDECNEIIASSYFPGIPTLLNMSDENIIEKLSDLICHTLSLNPFQTGNKELSLMISAYVLANIRKPYFILENITEREFDEAATHPLKMRVFVADKYKQYIQVEDQILKAIQFYDSAAEYKSLNGRETTILMEWHELDRKVAQWKHKLAR